MSYRLSSRVNRIKPSPTLALTARAQAMRAEGKDIIALSAGEPDFGTPATISQAGIGAIESGQTRYTAVDGIPALKEAIKEKFQRDNGLSYELDQILVSCGGKHSIFNTFLALLEENSEDEVIIPAPYWVSYPDMVMLAGGQPVIVPTSDASRHKITPEALEKAITPNTRLLILNTPSNPTGMAYTADELKALAVVLKAHPHVMILSDDIYEHIIWADGGFVNLPMVAPELIDRTIVVNGVSKAYAMTGWRIGYAAGPQTVIKGMKKIQSQSTSNPCSVAQHAAVEALHSPNSIFDPMVETFKRRHDFLIAGLNAFPGISCQPGDGAFYAFPNVQGAMDARGFVSDSELAEAWLNEAGIAAVPGSAFGAEGYLRLSFATSDENLEKALSRLKDVC